MMCGSGRIYVAARARSDTVMYTVLFAERRFRKMFKARYKPPNRLHITSDPFDGVFVDRVPNDI